MATDSDVAVVEAWRSGDRAAFATLVRRYQKPVYNAAYRILGNADDASDTTQAVFLKVTERRHGYDPRFRFFSWLYRIAVNEALNVLRRNGREQPLAGLPDEGEEMPGGDASNPEWQAAATQVSRRIEAAMMQMSPEHRVVIALRHFSECSYGEIAEILDIEEKTVKSRLFEARGRLAKVLDDLRETCA